VLELIEDHRGDTYQDLCPACVSEEIEARHRDTEA
jgi:hypothetical protein